MKIIALAAALIIGALSVSAEESDAKAQYNLGVTYENGEGVPQDYAEAVKWYRLAAEQGDARAQRNLGVMYDSGWGVPLDYTEAVKWYRLAAEQGNAEAQRNLGVMYHYGDGVPVNITEAEKWYRLAAEQGYAPAQLSLGGMYYKGRDLSRDFFEAVKWYRLAAEQGNEKAQRRLERIFPNGVPQGDNLLPVIEFTSERCSNVPEFTEFIFEKSWRDRELGRDKTRVLIDLNKFSEMGRWFEEKKHEIFALPLDVTSLAGHEAFFAQMPEFAVKLEAECMAQVNQ